MATWYKFRPWYTRKPIFTRVVAGCAKPKIGAQGCAASSGLTSHHLGELHVPQKPDLPPCPPRFSSKKRSPSRLLLPPFPDAKSPLHDTNRYTALRESSETAFARIPTRHPRMGLAQPCWRQLLKSASPSRNLGNEIERIIEVFHYSFSR